MKKIPMLEKFAAQSLVEHGGELIFSKEKFAELIVRECARIAWNTQYKPVPLQPGSPNDCSNAIKQHFGVEE